VTFGAPVLNALSPYTKGTSQTVTCPAVSGAKRSNPGRHFGFRQRLFANRKHADRDLYRALQWFAFLLPAPPRRTEDRALRATAISFPPPKTTAIPIVAITAPANGATTNQTTVNVQGTASDAISGVASVLVNGVAVSDG